MLNELYLYLLARYEHHDQCKADRCVASCEVAKFIDRLEQPLLLADIARQQRERERLVALAKGEIPEAV